MLFRYAFVFSIVSLLMSCASTRSAQRAESKAPTSIDEVAQRAVRPMMESEPAPTAVVVGVTAGGARSVFGFGAVDGVPPDASTRFRLGTATQPLTATLVATWVAEDELRYDDTIGSRTCDASQVTAFCFRGDATTYRHLVQHTAGFPTEPDRSEWPAVTEDDLHDFLAGYNLGLSPGKRFRRSSVGYATLGSVLQRRFGTPVGTAIQERVTTPLNMTSTTVGSPGDVISGTHEGEPAVVGEFPAAIEAALGGVSNVSDILTFLEAQLHPEESPQLGEALELTQRVSDAVSVEHQSRAGLGWFQMGSDTYWYVGHIEGFHAFFAFDKASDIGVVILANESAMSDFAGRGFEVLEGVRALRSEGGRLNPE